MDKQISCCDPCCLCYTTSEPPYCTAWNAPFYAPCVYMPCGVPNNPGCCCPPCPPRVIYTYLF